MKLPRRKTSNLRKGRVSLPGARYFVTICEKRREPRLACLPVAGAVLDVLARIETDGDGAVMAALLMPDHLHLLVLLGSRLSIGRFIGKLKSLTMPVLLQSSLAWQDDFFEHRLRPEDRSGNFARCIFLNPYRVDLIGRREEWPWWRAAPRHDFDFLHMLEDGRFPPQEWLEMDDEALGVTREAVGYD